MEMPDCLCGVNSWKRRGIVESFEANRPYQKRYQCQKCGNIILFVHAGHDIGRP